MGTVSVAYRRDRIVSVFSLNSGEPVSSMCSASASALGRSMECFGSSGSGIVSGSCSRMLMIRSSADQTTSASVCSEISMHMGLFYEDVGALEMYEHLLGHQNPRGGS